jgi:hypothetical protein
VGLKGATEGVPGMGLVFTLDKVQVIWPQARLVLYQREQRHSRHNLLVRKVFGDLSTNNMFGRICLSTLAVVALQLSADAYPTGAGDCPARTAAVGGSHLTATTITNGDLNDFGVELLINGLSISAAAPFDVPIGQDHVWELVSPGFRGFLLRLDGGDDEIDTIDALGPVLGMGGMVQVAEVCTRQGVGGVTHRSRQLKNATSGSLRLDQESRGMNLDVTVVIENVNGLSEYYYSSYILNAVKSAFSVTLPSPTPAPVPQPTRKRPTMAPVPAPTMKKPTPAPEAQPTPVPQPTPKSPVLPLAEPLATAEDDFQFATFSPTFVPTMYPTFGTMDVAAPTNPFPPPESVLEPTFSGGAVGSRLTMDPTFGGTESLLEDESTVVSLEPFLVSVDPSCSVNNTCGPCEGELSTVFQLLQWIHQ